MNLYRYFFRLKMLSLDCNGTEKETAKRKAANSKRPREESSTRPPPKLRPIMGLQVGKAKNARFDPRFSTTCGDFDEFAFHRDYAFLEEYREHDIQELQKAHRQAKRQHNLPQAERLKRNLLRLKNQQKASRDQRLMEEIRTELRQTNIERMNQGKPPIYLNNQELKERFLERKGQLCGEKEEPQGRKLLEEGKETTADEEDKDEEAIKQTDEDVGVKKPWDMEKRGKPTRNNYKH